MIGEKPNFLPVAKMKAIQTVLLLLIVRATVAHEQIFNYTEVELPGACPKIKYINSLDFPRILGWYYGPFTTLSSPQCYNNNEGLTVYAASYDENTMLVNFCCRSAVSPKIATCGSHIGSGTVRPTSVPGALTFSYGKHVYTIYILDTDYDNYTVVYACNPNGSRKRDELILVHTRDYHLSKPLEQRVRTVLQQNDINWSCLMPTKQGPSVPYTPNSRRCDKGRIGV